MSDITVIGLGLMGAALARAIQSAGHDLTVWNRSAAKTQPFADSGASAAADIASAVSASPVLLICIDNYASTHAMLSQENITPLLAGRTVIQLSTGSPKQAEEAAEWMNANQAHYLDGAILAGPNEIGTDDGQILLCGDEKGHSQSGDLLDCLCGQVRYLGTNVRAASALDLAWLTVCYGDFISVAHAVNLCRSEGADLGDFISLFPESPNVQTLTQTVHEDTFGECTATLDVWGEALAKIQQQGIDAGINTDFPDFAANYFKKASAAGYGQGHAMAVYKVLRDGDG